MRFEGKLRVIVISSVVVICSAMLFVLIWIRDSMPLGYQILVDWLIVLLSILLEVFGISLFLDWLIGFGRKRRLEPRRQIALRRLFIAISRDLYISLARYNKTGEPLTEEEDLRLRAKGMVTPSSNLPLDRYILQVVNAIQFASKDIMGLIDKFENLFEIEFVNDLFQLEATGHRMVSDGEFMQHRVFSKKDDGERIIIAEKVNETFDPMRQQLMELCTEFVVKRIYPQSSSVLKGLIRFYLLNFFVAYYPEICDLVLNGNRMKISS